MKYVVSDIEHPRPVSRLQKKENWVAYIIAFLFFSKWIVPLSIRRTLLVSFVGIPLYLPNLLIIPLLYICLKRRNSLSRSFNTLLLTQLFLLLIGVFVNPYDNRFIHLIAGTYYFYAMFFAVNFRLSQNQQMVLKKLLLCFFVFISIEIILFSYGILTWTNDVTSTVTVVDGVFRFNSTLGSPTMGSQIMCILGCLLYYYYEKTKIGYAILGVTLTILLIQMSRGGLAAFVFVMAFYFFKTIKSNNKTFRFVVSALLIILVIQHFGLFDIMIERNESLSEDLTSGRDSHINRTLKMINDNQSWVFGLGVANVFQTEDMDWLKYVCFYHEAPHNCWILTYAEQGLIGFFLMMVFWLKYLWTIRKTGILFLISLSVALIMFNTETVTMVEQSSVFLIALLMIVSLDKAELLKKNKNGIV